jgi:hypothetical protein
MNKKVLYGLGVVVLLGIAAGSFFVGRASKKNDATTNPTPVTQAEVKAAPPSPTTNPVSPPTPSPVTTKPSITKWDPAGFVTASYSRKLTDFTPWQDSPVQSTVKDFNGDGLDDVFVWAKLPGTKGYSTAAVWTLGSNDQPKELWYVPTAQVYVQSSWSVSGLQIIETGKLETPNGLSDEKNTYVWKTNTFVTL